MRTTEGVRTRPEAGVENAIQCVEWALQFRLSPNDVAYLEQAIYYLQLFGRDHDHPSVSV